MQRCGQAVLPGCLKNLLSLAFVLGANVYGRLAMAAAAALSKGVVMAAWTAAAMANES